MAILVRCANPRCKQSLRAQDALAGKCIKCPGCGQINRLPARSTVARPAVVPRPVESEATPSGSRLWVAAVIGIILMGNVALALYFDLPRKLLAELPAQTHVAEQRDTRPLSPPAPEPKPDPKPAPRPEPPPEPKPEPKPEPPPKPEPKPAPPPEPKAGPKPLPKPEARPTPRPAPSASFWLGRKPRADVNEYVFDVRIPPDMAGALLCLDGRYGKFRPGVRQFEWEADGQVVNLAQNPILWERSMLDRGQFAFSREALTPDSWVTVRTNNPDWNACKKELDAQGEPMGNWKLLAPLVLRSSGTDNPRLTLNLDTDRPYDVRRDGPTKKPQIVPVLHQGELYVAWHTWGSRGPTGKIFVSKIALDTLDRGKLTTVRELASRGVLVGFTVDAAGADHVLSAVAEELPNVPPENFVKDIHEKWRPNVVTLFSAGKAADLNSDRYTPLPFYGLTNAGSGRLASGAEYLAAVFSRREFSSGDGLIHQTAVSLLTGRDPANVVQKAAWGASHSFDQRLIFDGTDFVVLHQCDTMPSAGLLIERLRPNAKPTTVRHAVYTCPTFGNAVYFELGGLAAEPDGYPVLFTTTRNIGPVNDSNVTAMHNMAWDLAMVYAVRDFEAKPAGENPYDLVGSGVLHEGYADDQEFAVNNFTYNPKTTRFDKADPRTIKRRVAWLTENNATTKATNAKLVKLRDGQYVAVWEEHTFAGEQWTYATTRAMTIALGRDGTNRTIRPGRRVELRGVRLPPGDDALALPDGSSAVAAWLTAGATNRQLLLHTLDETLTHRSYPLALPR